MLLSYSFSSRALCSCVKSRREKEKKKDLRLSKKEIENKEKCREPKFGRSQGKAKTSFLLRPTQRRLCCAPPLPEKADHALPGKKGARARRRAGREAPRYQGEGKEKCKRPAGNGEGGQKKSDDEKLPLSLSTPGLFTFCCTLEADGGPQGAVASRPVNELEGEKRGIVSEKGRRTR